MATAVSLASLWCLCFPFFLEQKRVYTCVCVCVWDRSLQGSDCCRCDIVKQKQPPLTDWHLKPHIAELSLIPLKHKGNSWEDYNEQPNYAERKKTASGWNTLNFENVIICQPWVKTQSGENTGSFMWVYKGGLVSVFKFYSKVEHLPCDKLGIHSDKMVTGMKVTQAYAVQQVVLKNTEHQNTWRSVLAVL